MKCYELVEKLIDEDRRFILVASGEYTDEVIFFENGEICHWYFNEDGIVTDRWCYTATNGELDLVDEFATNARWYGLDNVEWC